MIFIRDGVVITGGAAPSYAIAEIGSLGEYSLAIAGGFPTAGTWFLKVDIAYNGHIWRSDVEVRLYTIQGLDYNN